MIVRTRFELGGLVCALLAMTACGAQNDVAFDDGAVGQQAQALTTAETVLGFESTQVWSVNSGTLATTTTHSQGSLALSLTPNGYEQIVSVPLSTLGNVTSTLSVDVRPSAPLSWGQLQLFFNIPSRGLYTAFVGQASLQGLSSSAFTRVDFALPSNVMQALSGSYSDLTITIGVGVPQGSVTLDNLRFGGEPSEDCAAGSAYTLSISGAEDVDAATVEGIRCTFYEVYPQLSAAYNPDAQLAVPLTFLEEQPKMPPAWASGGALRAEGVGAEQEPPALVGVLHDEHGRPAAAGRVVHVGALGALRGRAVRPVDLGLPQSVGERVHLPHVHASVGRREARRQGVYPVPQVAGALL